MFYGLLFDTMPIIYHLSVFMKRLITLAIMLLSLNSFAMSHKLDWDQAVDRAIKRYGLRVEPQLKSYFTKAKVSYPPAKLRCLHLNQSVE